MLHRFRSPENPAGVHDPAAIRRALAHLRKEGYQLLSLEQLVRAAIDEQVPDRSIAFTIDDGYLDHATVAAPLFAEFDCPVTTFVTTGFLDGKLWFWWDRIEYVFANTPRHSLRIDITDRAVHYQWSNPSERDTAQVHFTNQCKLVLDDEKHEAIARLAVEAEVELPELPPPAYGPMSWEQLRACEQRGMSFGPHTVTHPVLSRVSDERSAWELRESWRRLREEARAPVPIFCYPNGQREDFSEREIETLEQINFLGAVIGSGGFVSSRTKRREAHAMFTMRRYPFPADLPHLVQYASGIESARMLLRGQPA